MIWLYASLIAVAPLYIWRFELVGLPTNFFMVYAFAVVLIGSFVILYKGQLRESWKISKEIPAVLKWSVLVFYGASIISLFVGGFTLPKLAQWLVLYGLPIKLAGQFYFFLKQQPDKKHVALNIIYIFLFTVGLVAIAQYFWLITLPPDWWGNANEPKRAIGFFIHPNNLALFITPLLAYTLPQIKTSLESWWASLPKIINQNFWPLLAWGLGAIALLLSLSRGGWLGLAISGAVFVTMAGNKQLRRIALITAVIGIIIVVAVPNLRYRVILPFYGEKSSVARLSLWETGTKMIKDSPILGQGVNGFNYNWDKFNTDPNLEHYNFPHNFVLNTWIDTGLLGLLSWLVIVGYGLWYGFKNRAKPFAFGLALFLLALLLHGLIDIPYFKNDLAMVFWLIFALAL